MEKRNPTPTDIFAEYILSEDLDQKPQWSKSLQESRRHLQVMAAGERTVPWGVGESPQQLPAGPQLACDLTRVPGPLCGGAWHVAGCTSVLVYASTGCLVSEMPRYSCACKTCRAPAPSGSEHYLWFVSAQKAIHWYMFVELEIGIHFARTTAETVGSFVKKQNLAWQSLGQHQTLDAKDLLDGYFS